MDCTNKPSPAAAKLKVVVAKEPRIRSLQCQLMDDLTGMTPASPNSDFL